MDRIDIHVEVPRVEFEKLSNQRLGEPSLSIRERVESARLQQLERFSKINQTNSDDSAISIKTCNADMGPGDIRKICQVDESGENLMRTAMRQLQLSARAYHRILKLARTIADLAGLEKIEPNHIAEALQYRPKLMMDG